MGTSHGSKADVFANGYVLSPFFNSFSSSSQRDTAETTTFKKQSKTYIPGLKDNSMSSEGLYEGEVGLVDEILTAALSAGAVIFSYMPAGHEVFGNPAFTMDAFESTYEVTSDVGDANQISAEFTAGDTGIFDRGKVFHPMAAEVAPGNTANFDNTVVSTANGAALTVHATASTTLVAFLQDSADGTTFADLAGSLAFGAARGSQRLVVTGTIRRYLRVRWTGTGTFAAIASRL